VKAAQGRCVKQPEFAMFEAKLQIRDGATHKLIAVSLFALNLGVTLLLAPVHLRKERATI